MSVNTALPQAQIDDFGDDPASAGVLEVFSGFELDDGSVIDLGVATGAIEAAGDEDWFAIELTAGEGYVIEVLGATNGGGDLADPFLTVYDAAGTAIAQNDDLVPPQPDGSVAVDLDPLLEFVAPESGTYYVGASAFGAATGGYTVGVLGEPGTLPSPPTALVPADDPFGLA